MKVSSSEAVTHISFKEAYEAAAFCTTSLW